MRVSLSMIQETLASFARTLGSILNEAELAEIQHDYNRYNPYGTGLIRKLEECEKRIRDFQLSTNNQVRWLNTHSDCMLSQLILSLSAKG